MSSTLRPHQSEGDVNLSPRRREWAEQNIDETSKSLLERDAKSFLHQSVSTPCLNTISKAEGPYIYDGQGRKLLDFHGNNVHHIGYGHPKLKEAITRQMNDLPFAPRRFTCEPAVELAEKLAAVSPGDLSKVLYATGGSDAIEMALKVARAKTGRFKTISFWDAFHGAGFGASSIGGEQLFRGQAIGPLLPGTEHVAPYACYRCPYGYEVNAQGEPDLPTCKMTCANMVRYVLEKEGNVAAVIAEPARAVPYTPPPGFWKEVRQACNEAGALLIFDEIPTGLGKTGRFFACDHDEVVPDILVMGKALGGGILPIAATLCHPDLDVLGEYAIGHYTHEKNPVTTRAALTTIEIIEEEGLVENAATVGVYALERMQDMKARFPVVGDVRGRGFLLGMELVTDQETKNPATDTAEEILYKSFDAGLSFKTTMGNVLTFTPSLVTSLKEMEFAMDVIENGLRDLTY
ncbi:aspartate aminotransferase family protein [Sneathiella limimaris]|uniref:(R)-1-hydroxy-2-aminoethylphosphonate ammonia-lyase n=1 Tax=Sneathiella limimaris TaxID=1964213 RepID=UPI00146B0683|nr:aspartate aminotransferase family protein [Sneathiella limimaris]